MAYRARRVINYRGTTKRDGFKKRFVFNNNTALKKIKHEKDMFSLNNTYIIAIAKDEDPYIDEWIKYHLSIGVSKIILFMHDWTYDLSKYGKSVETYNVSCDDHGKIQLSCYNKILKILKEGNECKYVACIDVDEFISFKEKFIGKSITEILDFYNEKYNFDTLALPWKMFGNKDVKYDGVNYSVIDRFTKCAKDYGDCGRNNLCKLIVNLENNYGYIQGFHGGPNMKTTFITGRRVVGHTFLNDFLVKDEDVDLYLSHYYVKTFEEYAKRAKGKHVFGVIGNTIDKQWADRSNPIWNRTDVDNFDVKRIRDFYKLDENRKRINLCHWWFKDRQTLQFTMMEKMHITMIHCYAKRFDRVDLNVALSTEKEEYKEFIRDAFKSLKNVSIVFVANTKNQEYETWKKILSEYTDCYVLYTHFKGVSHLKNPFIYGNMNDIAFWNFLIYKNAFIEPYFANKTFIGRWIASNHIFEKHYQGTFYWIDINRLHEKLKTMKIEFRKNSDPNRGPYSHACEQFPSFFDISELNYELSTNVTKYNPYISTRIIPFMHEMKNFENFLEYFKIKIEG